MHEVHGQHLGARHHVQELGMVAKLGYVVGRGSGGTTQLVGRGTKIVYQRGARLAREVFQDGAFIEHHARKQPGINAAHVIVVGDVYAGGEVLVERRQPDFFHRIAELRALGYRLPYHAQRREHQHGTRGVEHHAISPLQLLDGLAQPAIFEHSEPAGGEGAPYAVFLEREQHPVKFAFVYRETARLYGGLLGL